MNTINLESAYRVQRRRGYRPPYAIEQARKALAAHETARAAYALAPDDRAALEAATKARESVAWYGPAGAYLGTWQTEQGRYYCEKPDSVFRDVTPAHEAGTRAVDHNGWFSDPYGESYRDGTGLVWGVVAQLAGRDGAARYVAGYQQGGCDGGPTLDLSRIYEAPGEDYESARHEAARAADSMARRAAEQERDYQAAWQAGTQWQEARDAINTARKAAKALLIERRAARAAGAGAFPAICSAIETEARALFEAMQEARDSMAELARGDSDPLFFYPGKEARAAFCEGAGLSLDACPF